jgi:cytochrome c-type biogenesis protein CcmE
MKAKHRRLWFVLASVAMAALGIGMMLYAFSDNLVFFYTPSQLAEKMALSDFDRARTLRIGGMVKQGSVVNLKEGGVRFTVTDLTHEITVSYHGLIPSLFREGQGVVAQGNLQPDGSLIAATILAKHDETYMPREVVDALKKSGRWREGSGYIKPETK